MKLLEYIRIIRKRGWIVLLLAILTATSAIVFSLIQRPVYRATLYLNAIPVRLDWSVQQTIKNMLRNYARQITSDSTLGQVNDTLQLDMSPDMMREDITVNPVESDLLIQISVDNYDPMTAKHIADTTADVFVENIRVRMLDQDKQDRVDVFVSDYARPGILFKPKWKINAVAGGALGALLGILVIFFLEWLEADVIRSEDDVEHYIGLPVLGIIPSQETQTGSESSWKQRLALLLKSKATTDLPASNH